MAIFDGEYFYATNVLSVNGEHLVKWNATEDWYYYEHDDNHNNAIGQPNGDWFAITCTVSRIINGDGGSKGYESGASHIFLDFGIGFVMSASGFRLWSYMWSDFSHIGAIDEDILVSNDSDAWGDPDHPSWTDIASINDWFTLGWPDYIWSEATDAPFSLNDDSRYRYFYLRRMGNNSEASGHKARFQSFRFKPTDYDDIRYLWGEFGEANAKSLVCDHQYGDTLYLGLKDTDGRPIVYWVDSDFAGYSIGFTASSGSSVGVQTVETRDTCIAYGQFGTDKQIIISEDKLVTWDEAQGEFGDDDVLTLEFHPSSGSNLIATRKVDQDYVQTLTQRAPWTDLGATPFVARSQLRVRDDVWIGSDTGGSSVVQLLSGGSWADRGAGLPNVPINDLEST